MRIGTLRWLLLLVIVAVVETACGPIRSTAGLVDAQKMLKAAENEQAETVALFELTLARKYLDKAYEELGYNDYYMAEQMALKSEEYAEIALQKALGTEIIEPSDLGDRMEQPDLDVIPEEGELDPTRRAGDEDVGDVVLEQDDGTGPTGTETPAAGAEETTPAPDSGAAEPADEAEETTPANPWQGNP